MKLFPSWALPGALLLLTTASALPQGDLPAYITANNSPSPTDAAFISTALSKVNAIRAIYSAAPLEWSAPIAAVALNKSNGCILNHEGIYGENAYAFWVNPPDRKLDFLDQTRKAFDAWAADHERLAYLDGRLLDGGHFTQTVWKASRFMGCAFSTVRCANNVNQEWWFYCDFDPAGNVIGDYERNVST